jgi:hypothetical protein
MSKADIPGKKALEGLLQTAYITPTVSVFSRTAYLSRLAVSVFNRTVNLPRRRLAYSQQEKFSYTSIIT